MKDWIVNRLTEDRWSPELISHQVCQAEVKENNSGPILLSKSSQG